MRRASAAAEEQLAEEAARTARAEEHDTIIPHVREQKRVYSQSANVAHQDHVGRDVRHNRELTEYLNAAQNHVAQRRTRNSNSRTSGSTKC